MMSREEFEEWLEEHREEALSRVEEMRLPTKKWIRLYSRALLAELEEESSARTYDDDDDEGELVFNTEED